MEPAWKEERSYHPNLIPRIRRPTMSCRSTRNTAGCIQYWGNCAYIFFAELTAGLGGRIYLRYVCIHTLANSCAEQHFGSHVIRMTFSSVRHFPLSRFSSALLPRRIVLFSDAMRLPCLSAPWSFVSWGHGSHHNPCVSWEEESMLTQGKHCMALKHGGLECFQLLF